MHKEILIIQKVKVQTLNYKEIKQDFIKNRNVV